VENGWAREVEGNRKGVADAVKGVLGELVDWSRNVLGDLEKGIKKLKKELEGWRRKEISEEQVRKEDMLRFKLSRLEDQREIYWKGSRPLDERWRPEYQIFPLVCLREEEEKPHQ
jgi:hypothetical protein